MTLDELEKIFDEYNDEYLEFDRVEVKFSKRPDLHAYIMLDKIMPETDMDMICAAEHDEFYLEPTPEDLAERATKEQIIDLIRCGVRYSEGSLCMFS